MVDIQSKEVIDKMSEDLKVQPSLTLPRVLGTTIQPTYEVNPVLKPRNFQAAISDALAVTILTTDPIKRTFLHSVFLTVAKDVVSTSTFTRIDGFALGSSTTSSENFLIVRYEPVTVGSNITAQMRFDPPIELQKGALLRVRHGNATASIDGTAIVVISNSDPL